MRASFEQVDITPPIGVPMGGNSRADSRNRGVHDPLYASILCIAEGESGSNYFVSFDLVALSDSLVDQVRNELARLGEVDPASAVFFATHTHSGPATTGGNGFDTTDYSAVDEWERTIAPQVAAGIVRAKNQLRQASMRVHRAEAPGFAFNRRLLDSDGHAHMNWAPVPADSVPAGPTDDRLTVWTFLDTQARVIGALVHFTLHPAVLVGHDWLTSSDYVDSLRDSMQKALGDVPVVYAGGAFGNINHLDAHQSGRAIGFAETERIGRGIANAFHSVIGEGVEDNGGVSLTSFEVALAQRTISAAALAEAKRMVDENAGRPIDVLDGRPPVAYALWTVQVGQYLEPTLQIEVNVAEIGSSTLVFLPFEVFVEFGLELQRQFPDRLVKVVSLANRSLGYLPTAAAFTQGGYEPTLGTSTITAGQGEFLFAEIANWLRQRETATASDSARVIIDSAEEGRGGTHVAQ